jgi:hydrogen cyanide synthase HcnB
MRRRTPVWTRTGLVRIEGIEGVKRAILARIDGTWRPIAGTERAVDVDTVVLGYGLVPSPELADLAGCALAHDVDRGGWVPVSDLERLMATSTPGIFVAGDGAGVGGADVAEEEGRLAGLGAALFVGKLAAAEAQARAAPVLQRLRRFNAFRRSLGRILAPRPGLFELATDDTIICRCEEVSGAEVRVAIQEGARRVAEVRALTRAGMGLCQGRFCVPTLMGLLGRWGGVPAEVAGRLPPRLPARPVPIPVLADPILDAIPVPTREAVPR